MTKRRLLSVILATYIVATALTALFFIQLKQVKDLDERIAEASIQTESAKVSMEASQWKMEAFGTELRDILHREDIYREFPGTLEENTNYDLIKYPDLVIHLPEDLRDYGSTYLSYQEYHRQLITKWHDNAARALKAAQAEKGLLEKKMDNQLNKLRSLL